MDDDAHASPPPDAASISDVRTFYASRRKWLGIAALSLAFVVTGVIMVGNDRWIGWLPIVVFGLSSTIAIAQLVRPAKLVIGPTTIEAGSIGRTQTFRLADCGEFRVWRLPLGRNRLVVFDYAGAAPSRLGRANTSLAGASSALPDTYGLPAEELAVMLNAARAAASDPDI